MSLKSHRLTVDLDEIVIRRGSFWVHLSIFDQSFFSCSDELRKVPQSTLECKARMMSRKGLLLSFGSRNQPFTSPCFYLSFLSRFVLTYIWYRAVAGLKIITKGWLRLTTSQKIDSMKVILMKVILRLHLDSEYLVVELKVFFY